MKNQDAYPAISIRNLSYRYGNQAVLENIDVNIAAGRFTVVLGKNGSGKSTLFRLIAGFLKCSEGEISLLGRAIATFSDRERARILGFLPQRHRPVFPFTVLDVVLTGRAGHVQFTPKKEDRLLAHEALARIGIEVLENRLFTELSGGEQQLVMLARILAQKPQIILLDEPISHLDFAYQAKVMAIIGELVR
jgi:iron complex transport system ATP-binding protein